MEKLEIEESFVFPDLKKTLKYLSIKSWNLIRITQNICLYSKKVNESSVYNKMF